MEFVKDLSWRPGMDIASLVSQYESLGFQSILLKKAKDVIVKMKKEEAKIFLTFTSNMATSGLRGFFAQLVDLGMVDVVCCTAGAIEEDIMKSMGEQFAISSFNADDVALHEKGMNRVGNLLISNESYAQLESKMKEYLHAIYVKQPRLSTNEFLHELGLLLDDESSFLYQAAKHNVPIFCPALTDGALGFHLYMFQQKHPDFIVDQIKEFSRMLSTNSYDEKKGIIALGGGISKHFAILGVMINGGFDYGVYISTARSGSGSMSGASTDEAKSWGKIKDDADAVTVTGDASILFPLTMIAALEELRNDGFV